MSKTAVRTLATADATYHVQFRRWVGNHAEDHNAPVTGLTNAIGAAVLVAEELNIAVVVVGPRSFQVYRSDIGNEYSMTIVPLEN